MRWLPTAEYLADCFNYDPDTGVLTWKTRPRHHFKTNRAHAAWNARYASRKAGSPDRKGYIRVIINKRLRSSAQQVIWAMQTGKWPEEIDHKNGDCADNRLENLRAVTRQQNAWNTGRRWWRDLPRGVGKANQKSRFVAGITINKHRIHLGTFNTPEEAHAAWVAYARRERGEFFRAE